MRWGSLPNRFEFKNENAIKSYLYDVFDSIILRDVVERLKIRDTALFNLILQYIIDTIGREFSAENIINFLTDRKVDMHCFMMDRLYHDAYGEEKAKSEIEKTKSDYIVLYEVNDVNNFYEPYLYSEYGSLAARYIFSNYKEVANYDNFSGKVKILKRK